MMKVALETGSGAGSRPPLTVRIAGVVDADGAAVLLDVVKAVVDMGHKHLTFDLDDATVIDIAGVAALSEIARIVRRCAGTVRLWRNTPALRTALAMIGSPHAMDGPAPVRALGGPGERLEPILLRMRSQRLRSQRLAALRVCPR